MNNSNCITYCVIRELAEALVQCEHQKVKCFKMFLIIAIVFNILFIFGTIKNLFRKKQHRD